MHKLVVMTLGFALAACASVPTEPRSIQCVHPDKSTKFVFDGHTKTEVKDRTLILTSPQEVVYFALPAGIACRDATGEQEEHER